MSKLKIRVRSVPKKQVSGLIWVTLLHIIQDPIKSGTLFDVKRPVWGFTLNNYPNNSANLVLATGHSFIGCTNQYFNVKYELCVAYFERSGS